MKNKIAFVADPPLEGAPNRVFNAAMRTANLDRDKFLITKLHDRLNEELVDATPNLIVPLGGSALHAFTGYSNISTFRGSVYTANQLSPGTKLLPTLHPEAVQKSWKFLPVLVGDLTKAAKESKFPGISYPRREILIEPTLQDIEAFAQECAVSDGLSVDIETGWGQITCIGFAPTQERAMCIPFLDLRKPNKNYWRSTEDEFKAWKLVRAICGNPAPKIGQNFTYDLLWLLEKKGIALRNYRKDTRLQHKVLYPELPADLASMSATYTRIGAYKHKGGHYKKDEKKDG